jgi:hypothetical protein
MYDSNFTCTYSFYDPVLRNEYHKDDKYDLDDIKEFEDMSEMIYRAELLQILGINNQEPYDNICESFGFKTENLMDIYNRVKFNADFLKCVENVKQLYSYKDLEDGYIALFSYDYFFLTHKCLCDFINFGKITDKNIINLRKAVNKNMFV